MNNYISIGKITNFFGIKGEAKVGYSNENQIKTAKTVYLLDDITKKELNIERIRFSKNFAIVKFKEINDINDIIPFRGQRIFILKDDAIKKLSKDEFLIEDLIDCKVYLENGDMIGTICAISTNSGQDILNIKNPFGKVDLVPFVNEFFPVVDIENKKIIIKPIEGLLS